ncbi:MAG: hypothetical protein J6T99_09495 [Oscillospiraceae bacterium]|nr:hypothetical protein [Oscillospiraceae bacterium]
MVAIIIKNVDMPKTCRDCPLIYDAYMCNAIPANFYTSDLLQIGFDSSEERLPDCPLEEIIEPDTIWNRLREIAEVEGLPDKAKEMIGDLMLSIYEGEEG